MVIKTFRYRSGAKLSQYQIRNDQNSKTRKKSECVKTDNGKISTRENVHKSVCLITGTAIIPLFEWGIPLAGGKYEFAETKEKAKLSAN